MSLAEAVCSQLAATRESYGVGCVRASREDIDVHWRRENGLHGFFWPCAHEAYWCPFDGNVLHVSFPDTRIVVSDADDGIMEIEVASESHREALMRRMPVVIGVAALRAIGFGW